MKIKTIIIKDDHIIVILYYTCMYMHMHIIGESMYIHVHVYKGQGSLLTW